MYESIIDQIENQIKKVRPKAKPKFIDIDTNPDNSEKVNYLLWMCREIKKMKDYGKASRWIG